MPNLRPTLARRPDLVVGIPVARAIFRLAFVMPSARFQLNEIPGPSFMALIMRSDGLGVKSRRQLGDGQRRRIHDISVDAHYSNRPDRRRRKRTACPQPDQFATGTSMLNG